MLNEHRSIRYVIEFAAELRENGDAQDVKRAAYLLEELCDEVEHLRTQVAELLPWALTGLDEHTVGSCPRIDNSDECCGSPAAHDLARRIAAGAFEEVAR
jgi:hypothetical protein